MAQRMDGEDPGGWTWVGLARARSLILPPRSSPLVKAQGAGSGQPMLEGGGGVGRPTREQRTRGSCGYVGCRAGGSPRRGTSLCQKLPGDPTGKHGGQHDNCIHFFPLRGRSSGAWLLLSLDRPPWARLGAQGHTLQALTFLCPLSSEGDHRVVAQDTSLGSLVAPGHPEAPAPLPNVVSRQCLVACAPASALGGTLQVPLAMLTPGPPLARRKYSPLSSRASLLLLPDPCPDPPGPSTSSRHLRASKLPCPCQLPWGPWPKALGAGWLCSVWWKTGQATQPACGWARARASPGRRLSIKLTKTLMCRGKSLL